MSEAPSHVPAYQRFFAELKRRRVFRVMAVYGATGFVVLQVADLLAEGLALPDVVLRTATFLVLLGFPIAVVLAWAFELTPGGVRRTEDATPGEIEEIVGASPRARWPSGLLALTGILALMAGAWWIGRSSAQSGAPVEVVRPASAAEILDVAYADLSEDVRPSVAVLPFVNMSPDDEQQYFADGMTEELLNALAKVRELRVAGRTSSFAYRDVEKDLREIGAELGVQYLVEGSIRKQDDRLRITAQLVDTDDAFHLWSETYDRTLDDVFAVQEEIAGAIAGELQVSLGLDEAGSLVSSTSDLAAYDLYLAARARMRERGEGVHEAVRLFEQVVDRDSMWAPGWAGLAQAYSLVPFYLPAARLGQPDADSWGPALEAAEEAGRRALVLDPRLAAAEVALGNVFRDRWEWVEAESHYLRALAIDPDDVEAHQQYGEMLAGMGRLDEALRSARRALALDPTSSIRLNAVAWILYTNDRAAESVPQSELAALHGPDLSMPRENLSRSLIRLGRLDEAERVVRQEWIPRLGLNEERSAEFDRLFAARFAALRDRDRAAYAECCGVLGMPGDWIIVGDTLTAIESLRDRFRGAPRHDATWLVWLWEPDMDPVRDDPRFQAVLAEVLDYAGLAGAELRRAPAGE